MPVTETVVEASAGTQCRSRLNYCWRNPSESRPARECPL